LIIDHEKREMRSADVIVSASATVVGGMCGRCSGGQYPPITTDESEEAASAVPPTPEERA
jgi:hypothetical protein